MNIENKSKFTYITLKKSLFGYYCKYKIQNDF